MITNVVTNHAMIVAAIAVPMLQGMIAACGGFGFRSETEPPRASGLNTSLSVPMPQTLELRVCVVRVRVPRMCMTGVRVVMTGRAKVDWAKVDWAKVDRAKVNWAKTGRAEVEMEVPSADTVTTKRTQLVVAGSLTPRFLTLLIRVVLIRVVLILGLNILGGEVLAMDMGTNGPRQQKFEGQDEQKRETHDF